MSTPTLDILLVEDNPGDARLIREMLQDAEDIEFTIDWVPRLADALEKLGRGESDLVLLDLGLPDSRGLETFVQAFSHSPQVPFVVLSGLDDETLALTAVREGAQDYLVKGQTDSSMLLRTIRYATERKRIEEELRLANEELESRVAARTEELRRTNEDLRRENAQRRQAERALQLAHDTLEMKVAMRTAELAKANAELRQEITVRRAAEMAVEAERQRLYSLLERLPTLVSLIAPDFSILYANQVFEETFGSWRGKRCYEVVASRKEPCAGCPVVEVMENHASCMKELTIARNGRVFSIYKYPFTDVDGSNLVLSLGIDVTQRRRAEEAVEAERRRLYALLDGLPGLVYLKAPDFSLRFANRLFRETCGDWEGKKCYEAIFKTERPCEHCTQFQVIDTGKPSVKEAAYGESNRTYQVYSYPFADVDGSSLVLTLGIDISERKRAEQEVARLASFPELNPHPVLEVKGNGEITYYNAATIKALEKLAVSGNEKLFLPPDFETILQTVRGTETRKFSREVQFKDAVFEEYIDVIPQFDVARIRAYNITARKRAEEELRQSRARLAMAQRLARLGNWELDLKSGEFIWSDEVFRIFGLNPKSFSPSLEALMAYIHPDDAARVRKSLEDAMTGVNPCILVSRIVRPDNSIRFVQCQAEAVPDASGQPWRLLGTAQDITERRTAEMRLRDSQARFRAIFESAALGIALTDLEGRFLMVNAVLHQMLGYRSEELQGKSFLDITHPEDRQLNWQLFQDLKTRKRDQYRLEKRLLSRDGSDLWVRATASPVRWMGDEPRYIVGLIEDITERKATEEKLRESEKNLRQLASQLLTAQEDERKRISQELHDELGQALLVLKLQTRSVEQELQPGQESLRAECLEMLANLDQVVNNVRRLSHDLSPLMLEDLGLSVALERLIREFCKHYNIEYSSPETNLNNLFTLETQTVIYRLFQETLTNIGKHSQATGLTVSVAKNADRVAFLIQDNGKGFNLERVRRQPPGMGLAAMQERVQMLGGTMSIWSQEGAGSRISFEIPHSPRPN